MSQTGEAAEQIVNMATNVTVKGVECVANLSGKAAVSLAAFLIAALKDEKRVSGKTRMRSFRGKPTQVFVIQQRELRAFAQEAKKYGILYAAVVDKRNPDGLCDIVVSAEDAARVNRIADRFALSAVDVEKIREDIIKARKLTAEQTQPGQNAGGAKQPARCQEAYRFCQRVAIAFSLAAGLAFFVFAPALAARFAPDAQAAEAARRALRLQSIAFPAQSAVILMTMLTQAMGLTLRASLVATSRQALFFLPLLAVLPRLFGLWGLLACQSASDLAALGFSLALTRRLRGSSSARCGCSDARTVCRSHPRSSS